MNSPALAIGYMLWLRLRWAMAATSLYLLCLAIAVRLFPNSGEPVVLAVLVLISSVAHMLQVFTLAPADLGATRSGFPANMFALPMPTRALAGWPMLYAAVVHVALWLIVVYFVLVPAGFSPPVWWPAAAIAAITAWIQATGWSPFPIPFARVPAMAVAMIPVVLLAILAAVYLESRIVSGLVVAGTSVWIACAYGLAVHGLSRARCGNEANWARLPRAIRSRRALRNLARTRPVQRPFRSAGMAQLWHECRRNATFLPAMMAFFGLPILALNCLAVLNPGADRTLLFGSVAVSPAAVSLLIWLAIPMMLAMSLGPGLAKFDYWGKDAIPSFFAVRPMTTPQFIALKLTATAISTCASCAVVLWFVMVWALVEISPLNPHASLVRSTFMELTPRRGLIAGLVLVGLIAFTWREIVIGMWPSLSGRKWLSRTVGFVTMGQLTIAVLLGGWIYRHPDMQSRLVTAVPWLIGWVLTVKLCGIIGAVVALRKRRLTGWRTLATIVGCWLAAAAGILIALSYLTAINWQLTAVVPLSLPLVRILVAPLALDFNRHR